MIHLEGDKLEVTAVDLENLRFLTGDRLTVINPVKAPDVHGQDILPSRHFYDDEVLMFIIVALIVFVAMNFVISIFFIVRRQQLKGLEVATMNEMLEIRKTSINAKTNRYSIENFQRKNPTKSFAEALSAVYNIPVDQKAQTPQCRPSRAALLEAMSKKVN
ncbi:hypothetical protein GCK32_015945 [Trichostrongylus colubriformis]|uniref:Uncharacterized protein n=1 Tax=Trichostrongylus colubriformis TaxID=6319 RepID=A0AAN8FEM0_TRICO